MVVSYSASSFPDMGKALKKRQKWRNLNISPPPMVSRGGDHQQEEGGDEAAHPFLKIISKNLDVIISKDTSSATATPSPAASSPTGAATAVASDRVKFFYRSDRVPVFDPANCTVVGVAGNADPVNTALFVGDPLRYAPANPTTFGRAGSQNLSNFALPPGQQVYVKSEFSASAPTAGIVAQAFSGQRFLSMSSSK
jgi:hypothetical protein